MLHNLLLAASLFDEGAASREKKRILEDVRKDHEKEVARLKADHEASIEAHRETHVHEDETTTFWENEVLHSNSCNKKTAANWTVLCKDGRDQQCVSELNGVLYREWSESYQERTETAET